MTLALVSDGAGETRALAGRVAGLLQAGDVVALTGELGAGKTCFVQGVAAALGVEGPVTSPTFTLVRTYDEVDPPLVHVDVYRLDRLHDVYDLGEDVLRPDGITLIEWGDAIVPLLPPDRLEVELRMVDGTEDRRALHIHPHGAWQARAGTLREALADWAGSA